MTWLRWIGIVESAGGAILLAAGMVKWQSQSVQLDAAFFGTFHTLPPWLMIFGIAGMLAGVVSILWGGRSRTAPA